MDQARLVHEDFLIVFVLNNKAEAFRLIKEFYFARFHGWVIVFGVKERAKIKAIFLSAVVMGPIITKEYRNRKANSATHELFSSTKMNNCRRAAEPPGQARRAAARDELWTQGRV